MPELKTSENPWLDESFNKNTAIPEALGFNIQDIVERVGIDTGDNSMSDLINQNYLKLTDTPDDYGQKGQFAQTDGMGNISWGWPHWIKAGNVLYYKEGRVGIGTTHPTHKFVVDGTGLDDNAASLLVTGGTQQFIQVDSASRARFICDAHDADASIEFQEDDVIKWVVGFDYTDSLTFTISEGVPGTNNRFEIAPGGTVTFPGSVIMNDLTVSTGSINVSGGSAQYVQVDSNSTATFIADAHDADAYLQLEEDNAIKWTVAFDYSDSLKFKISEGLPGINTRLEIISGGSMNVYDSGAAHLQIIASSSGTARLMADSYTGDAYVELQEQNVLKWCAGFDYTDSLAYVISEGAPGTNNRFKIVAGGAITILGTLGLTGALTLGTIAAGASDYDKFLVSDSGLVKYRTGANVLADIGAQPSDAELTAIAGLTSAAGKMIEFTGSGTAQVITVTTAGKALMDDAAASNQRTTLGLVIGTNVLAQQAIGIADDNLLEVDGSPSDNEYAKFTAAGLEGRTYANVLADLSGSAGAAFSWNSQNLTSIGTIGCDEITVADGHGINLQEDITFTGATSENIINIPDNLADALTFKQGAVDYLTFITTDDSEAVLISRKTGIGKAPDPGVYLHLYKGNSGGTLHVSATLGIESDGVAYFQFLNPNDQFCGFVFGDPDRWDSGAIYYSHTGDYLRFDAAASERMRLDPSGNLGLGQITWGTNAAKVFAQATGTVPASSPADCFQMYSADVVADHAAMHIRNENDTIIKLYQQALIADPAGQANDLDSEARTAIDAILDILENNGLMANA